MRKRKTRLYTPAFTLIELIITTLLIVVLCSVAIPVASLVANSRDRQMLESHAKMLNTHLKIIDTYVYTYTDTDSKKLPSSRSEEEVISLLYNSESTPKRLKQLLLDTGGKQISLSNLYENLEIDIATTEYEIVWDTIGQRFIVNKKDNVKNVNGKS